MSSANFEVVRRIYEEFNRTQDASVHEFDPDVEWHTAEDLPNSDTHRGHEGVAALVRDWAESFDQFGADVVELIEIGDCVIAPVVLHGRISGSSEETRLPETHVWRFRDGKVIEVHEYRTKELALEAVRARKGSVPL